MKTRGERMAKRVSRGDITGREKAAILLISLGPEYSAQIFKHLNNDEIEELTLEIANMRRVSPEEKDRVLDEFYEVCLAQEYISEGGIIKELPEKTSSKENFADGNP